jgi:hypothetical protein
MDRQQNNELNQNNESFKEIERCNSYKKNSSAPPTP